MSKRTAILCGVVCAVVLATVAVVQADSSAQIFVNSKGLQYVKHVNNLPAGTTTLRVRSILKAEQQVRIKSSAKAVDGSQLARTIDTRFRPAEEKQFVIVWGKAITDLNFIQILSIRTGHDGRSDSGKR